MTEHGSHSTDDEALSALLDGALSGDAASALRDRLAREPELAARFAAMERANRAVRAAYRDVVDEPLPQRTLDLLRAPGSSRVVNFEAKRRGGSRPIWLPQALAAGIALAVGLGLGFGLGQRSNDVDDVFVAATGLVAPGSPLHELLESAPSGERRRVGAAAAAEVRLTFRAVDGDWCRELTVTSPTAGNAALACRRDGDWRLELVGAAAADGGVYRPAGDDEPFGRAVDALLDGEALEPAAERALLANGWRGN